MTKFILGAIVLLVIASCAYLILCPLCVAQDEVVHSFVVEKEYRDCVRTLMKPETMEAMISMSDGRIIDKQWENLVLDIDRIMRPVWRVSGNAQFVLEINYPNAGKIVLELHQEIHVNQDFMDVSMELIRPADGVQVYSNHMLVQNEGSNRTRFTMRNKVVVAKRIPANYHDFMKTEVHNANVNGAHNAEICIRKYCQKSGLISIPLK